MNTKQFLQPAEIDILFQVKDSVDEYVPWLEDGVARGMPFNDHLAKAKEQREMIDSVISWLKLERNK